MEDPIEKLKGMNSRGYTLDEFVPVTREDEEFVVAIAPGSDGVFPKKIIIREQSTKYRVAEGVINKGERFTFVPPHSGFYTIEIIPKEPDDRIEETTE